MARTLPLRIGRLLERTRLVDRMRRQVAGGLHRTRVAIWLLRDFLAFFGRRSIRIIGAELGSIALRYGSMGMLYLFVDALSVGQTVELPFPPGAVLSLRDLFVVGVVVGILLLSLSSILQYSVRLWALRSAQQYEAHCGRRLLALASRLPSPEAPWATAAFRREPIHRFFGYARSCGFVTRQLVLLLPSAVSLGVGCAVLLWLDAATTALLGGLAALIVLAQYPLHGRAARASARSEQHRRDAMRMVSGVLGHLRPAPLPLPTDSAVLDRLFGKRGDLRRDISTHGDRLRGGEGAMLVARLGGNFLLGVALITLGGAIISGERAWAEVAVYVVVVRYVIKDFVSSGKFMAGLSRYFGPVERYLLFVRSAAAAAEPTRRPAAAAPRLALAVPHADGELGPLVALPGEIIAALLPPRVTTPFSVMLGDSSAADEPWPRPPAWIDGGLLHAEAPLAANAGLPGDVDADEVERIVATFASSDEARRFAPRWSARAPARMRTPPPLWLVCALKVVAAQLRGASCLAIESTVYAKLSPRWRAACRDQFTCGPTIIVHRSPARIGRYAERAVLLTDGEGFVTWLPVRPETRDRLAELARAAEERAGMAAERDDDDLLDDAL